MSAKHAKPNFSQSQVSELLKRLFRLTASEIRSLPSYDDQNFHVVPVEGGEYVLKIMNAEDSKNPALIEVQTHAMSFLYQNGLPAQTAMPTASGQLMSLEEIDCGNDCQKYLVRLLTYLPGTTISKVPLTPQLLYETGKTAARMDLILQEMEHPQLSVLQRENFKWSLSNFTMLEAFLSLLDGDPLQEVVKSVIHQYKSSVVPKRSGFRKCINHGDFNDLNVLVQPDERDGYKISGILDFGDMNSGYYIHELAIAIMYMMTEHPNPIEVGGPVLAGWESVLPLNEAERECLYVLVLSRFCQSLVLARHSVTLQPENTEYLMISSKRGVLILRQLWELGKEQVEKTDEFTTYSTWSLFVIRNHIFLDCKKGDNATAVNPRPTLTPLQVTELALTLYGVAATEITTLPSYLDQNFLVVDKEGTKYVLKIMNSEDSKNATLLEVQTLTLSFLRQRGFPAQTAVPTTTGQLMSMEEIGIIHADLSDQNILVTAVANGHHEVSGILDFSLLTNGCYVFEVAVMIMYLMLENPSPLDVGGAVLSGWESVMLLSDEERDSLFLLVLCRLCQSLVYGRHNVKKNPDNKKYLLATAKNGTRLLTKLWELGKKEVERKWFTDASTYSYN
ncbi:hydroxylysine kinase-like isoform X1 [Lates japonicus]|uniref:Hydroxylysine kinase n=1 Tax=Lates japonicus TaxID=270547 RepID=A0AAD3QZY1_LATJO|nr:hydroxylysine kinase-like isoform X1 [Lates japonicus]